MTYSDWILVGVDGSHGSEAAVRYAAREAVRRDVGLRLVHVAPARVQLAPLYPGFELSDTGLAAVAKEILAQSTAIALERVSLSRVSMAVLDGERADALSAEADRATLVVLGDQRRQRHETHLTSWTCDRVLARSTTPVVLVPAGWSMSREHGGVVAGARTPDASRDLIRTAVEEAHRRRSRLRIVHACQPAAPRRDVERLRHTLWSTAHAVAAEFPGVEPEVQIREGCPLDVIGSECKNAALLILEHPSGDEDEARGTIRTLLRDRRCPVEFLPSASMVPGPRRAEARASSGRALADAISR